MSDEPCNVEWRNGVAFCKAHKMEKLLDRSTYEARYGKLNQPNLGSVLICPVSKAMLSNTTALHDAIEEYGIELPE